MVMPRTTAKEPFAAGGAENEEGRRPTLVSAPPAAKGSLAVVRGMTISMFHLTPSRVNFRGVDVSSSLLGWTAPRHRVPELGCEQPRPEPSMTQYKRIGIDTSKAVFTLH